MKIVFNLHNVGLGNNGGSKTLVRCAEILALLGHEVVMYSNVESRFNWHKPIGVKMKGGKRPPASDIAIATGYKSVDSTVSSDASKKFYYIRGFELWQAKEKHLMASYKKLNCIVNSGWLKGHLEDRGISAKLIWAGMDFDRYYNLNEYRQDIIGGLFHKKHKTKRHSHIQQIAENSGYDLKMLGKDCKNPSLKKLNIFFNSIKVWIATTELEGFHNPPTETSLAGAGLVATDHSMSGMSDYAIDEETALIYNSGDLNQASENAKRLMTDNNLRLRLNNNMIDLLKSKIGSREDNMKKMVEYFNESK
jgi:hypothetical protein